MIKKISPSVLQMCIWTDESEKTKTENFNFLFGILVIKILVVKIPKGRKEKITI